LFKHLRVLFDLKAGDIIERLISKIRQYKTVDVVKRLSLLSRELLDENNCIRYVPIDRSQIHLPGLQLLKNDMNKLTVTEEGSRYYIKISGIVDGEIQFYEKIKDITESKL
jgi:hypothetical protein